MEPTLKPGGVTSSSTPSGPCLTMTSGPPSAGRTSTQYVSGPSSAMRRRSTLQGLSGTNVSGFRRSVHHETMAGGSGDHNHGTAGQIGPSRQFGLYMKVRNRRHPTAVSMRHKIAAQEFVYVVRMS